MRHAKQSLTRSEPISQKIAALLATLTFVSACSTVDYDYKRRNFDGEKRRGSLGSIYFHYADDAQPYEVKVSRVNHAYIAEAPIYQDGGMKINFNLERGKEVDNFAGLRSRWEF